MCHSTDVTRHTADNIHTQKMGPLIHRTQQTKAYPSTHSSAGPKANLYNTKQHSKKQKQKQIVFLAYIQIIQIGLIKSEQKKTAWYPFSANQIQTTWRGGLK